MSSSLNPSTIDPNDMTTLAPDVVVTRSDDHVANPEIPASAAQNGADAAPGAKAPPVDTTFRAASTAPPKGVPAAPAKAASTASGKAKPRKSLGRRLMRGVIGMVLTACVAGAAVLLQSHGDAARQIITKSVTPIVTALLSRESPATEQPSASTVVQASVVPGATAPSAPQNAADSPSSTASIPSSPEAAQVLQSLARELTNLRQDMEQMKAAIADLKASDDQMAREIVKASDKATDKALEQALRPRVSMVSPPQAQAVAMRRPPPTAGRSVQTRPGSVTPQVATSYVPRAAAPQSAAAPPVNLSAPPRPPASLREQVP